MLLVSLKIFAPLQVESGNAFGAIIMGDFHLTLLLLICHRSKLPYHLTT